MKWKHFPRYWPFVRRIHRSPVNSPHKGQWRGALIFSLICVWINDWVNNGEAGDLRRYRIHYDVTVMSTDPVCKFYSTSLRKILCSCFLVNLPNRAIVRRTWKTIPCRFQRNLWSSIHMKFPISRKEINFQFYGNHWKQKIVNLVHFSSLTVPPVTTKFQWMEMTQTFCGRSIAVLHDDVIKWKHVPRYWPFMRGIHRSLVNSPHKG